MKLLEKIPKSFKLINDTVTVVEDDMIYPVRHIMGEARFFGWEIALATSRNPDEELMNQEQKRNVFLHEMVHLILEKMGEDELNRNEKFVHLFSGLLMQAFDTMEFED